MKKPFDYERAIAGHPLVTTENYPAVYIGTNEMGVQAGEERIIIATVLESTPRTMRFDQNGLFIRGYLRGQAITMNDHRFNLYLSCPDEMRMMRAEELPPVCWVRCPERYRNISTVSYIHSSLQILGFADTRFSMRELLDIGAEWADGRSASTIGGLTWRKFEVVK